MYLTCRVALKPNKEQEQFFKDCANASRFIYNFSLNIKTQAYLKDKTNLNSNDITKYITKIKYEEEYQWLLKIPSETIKYAVKDLDNAFKKFYKGGGYPNFKKKSRTYPAFYTRYDKMYSIDNKHIKICGLKTPIKTYENTWIPDKPRNPRIKYDGKYWYLTYGVELIPENNNIPIIDKKFKNIEKLANKKGTEGIGVDLGILHTAYCSNKKEYENINKTYEVRRLEQKKKRLQRKLSKKYLLNKDGNKFIKTNNIIKLEKQIKLVQRRINNIRNTYNHKITTEIVKTKPSKIVIEDLDVTGMMKNKYLAKYIQEQKWYEIREQFTYKDEIYKSNLKIAPRYYASTKICSNCGYINKRITLADRIYKCPKCKETIDRDYNASINLSRVS